LGVEFAREQERGQQQQQQNKQLTTRKYF